MRPTRRDLLRLGAGALVATGTTVPGFLARAAALAPKAGTTKGRVLVTIELTGGNDGLNTVVPYKDDAYLKARPRLRLGADAVRKIDDKLGLHPALDGFSKLLEKNQLAIVQSVGYPNPNRSHFESMATWQAARLDAREDAPGWLARTLDARPLVPGADVGGLHIGDGQLPQAVAGGERHVPSLVNLDQFRRRLGLPEGAGDREQREALDALAGQSQGGPGSLLQFVERSTVLTWSSSARLEGALADKSGAAGYPEFYGLARRLRLIAQLVQAGLSTSIYYTALGGFDTHASQAATHDNLLRELGGSVQAFLADLAKSGDVDRVVVLVYSEFGRRLTENASAGTDHGTAAPVFLLGGAVKSGLHGPYPDLRDLADGDPKFAIDFRRVYATLLDNWLGVPSAKVLAGDFEKMALVRS